MDVNKSTSLANNPWVLCPSKSFPGKFYYFNVQNGEAAWSLNKEHIRPKTVSEATTPPIKSLANRLANNLPNSSQEQETSLHQNYLQNIPILGQHTPISCQQTPTIGQLSNLTTDSQQFIPKIFLTPLQIPVLSYISPDTVKSLAEPRFERLVETAPIDKKYLVHSSGIPLCHRFINYEKPSNINIEKKNNYFFPTNQYLNPDCQFQNETLNSNLELSESILNEESITIMNNERPKTPDNFRTERMQTEFPKDIPVYSESFVNMDTDLAMNDGKPDLNQVGIRNFTIVSENEIPEYNPLSSNSYEYKSVENIPSESIPSQIISQDMFENSPRSYNKEDLSSIINHYGENAMLNVEEENNLKNLSSTDLRFHLLAKRRKLETGGVLGYVEKKKPKLQENIKKKKVTFNLDNLQKDTRDNYRIVRYLTPNYTNEDCNIKYIGNDCTQFRKTQTENPQNSFSLTDNTPIEINSDTEKENSVRLIKYQTNYNALSLTDEYENIFNKHCDNDFDQIININKNSSENKKDISYIDNPDYIPFKNEMVNHNITINNTQKMNENDFIPNIRIQDHITNRRKKYIHPIKSQENIKINPQNNQISNENTIKVLQLNEKITRPYLHMNENSNGNLKLNENINIEYKNRETNLNDTVNGVVNKKNNFNENIINKIPVSSKYKDVWYLIVDLDVFIDDYLFVDKLVQSDHYCRLLVPSAILRELEALCIGDCRGEQRVLIARQISRRMDGFDNKIIVERTLKNQDNDANTTDLILKCCLNAVMNHYYVVLLTNDGYLKNRANYLNICCFTPQEVKNGATITPKLYAELKNIKFTIDNTSINNKIEQNNTHSISKDSSVNHFNKQYINTEQPYYTKCDPRYISTNLCQSNLTDKVIRLNLKDLECPSLSTFPRDVSLQKQIINKTNHCQKENFETHITHFKKPNIIENTKSHNSANKVITSTLINVSDSENNLNNIKNGTSESVNVSGTTNETRSNFKNPQYNFEDSLEKFTIKDKQMYFIIKTRMDEWICSYTQIMDEFFQYIIQKNCNHFSNMNTTTASICNLLMNIKILYKDAKLKYIIDSLVTLLIKNSCHKGKIKLDTKPQDFLHIVGYSVLLVQSLKVINPDSNVLPDCELYFEFLLNNMKVHNTGIDLDMIRPVVLCRSDVIDKNEFKSNFVKDKSFVIDYLKKHFKEWAAIDNINIEHTLRGENINVIRMEGKNIDKIKIDSKKSVSYIETSKENIPEKVETKMIKLLDDNLITKNSNETKSSKNDESILRKLFIKSQHILTASQNNIDLKSAENDKSHLINSESDDFPTNGNTFGQSNDTAGPKVILNLNSLSKFEETNQNKQPLNKKVLISSEINNYLENKHDNNIDSKHTEAIDEEDENSNKSIIKSNKCILKSNKVTKEIVNSGGITKKIINDELISQCDSDYININDIYGSRKYKQFRKRNYVSNEVKNYDTGERNNVMCVIDDRNNGNCVIHDRNNRNCVINDRNKVYCIKDDTNNEDCIIDDRNNENCVIDDRNNGICIIDDKNYESYVVNDRDKGNESREVDIKIENNNKGNGNINYDKINDDCDGNNDKYGDKNNLISLLTPKDDSTIDSGIENDSTQALTLIKTFLCELGVTFKAIYNFIDNFAAEIRTQNICEERNIILHNKANIGLEAMVALIQELESIIQRESLDDTILKNLFLRAGIEAATDKRITRYRQIIIKCLEQAQILESVLRIIVCITVGDFDAAPFNSDTICTNMRYFNIFE